MVSAGVNAVSAVVQPTPTGKLSDTGITTNQCGNASANAACPQTGFPQQDGETGRDATPATNNDADGHRGFNFTKLVTNGGGNGTANGGNCGATSNCDTSSYVAAVNTAGWCGATSGWRMPTLEELQSIADLSRNDPAAIDTAYFPHTVPNGYWSGTPYADDASDARVVYFYNGHANGGYRGNGYAVRLVRSGQ